MTIFVEAVHTVKPLTNTAFDAYVAWYGEFVIPALKRNGFDVVGAFKRTGGPMGQDVLLMRFESAAAYEKAGLSLRSDAAFLASTATVGSAFQVAESVKMAAPVPYATGQRIEKWLADRPAKPRQYMQAVLNIKSGLQPKFYDVLDRLVKLIDGSGSFELVAAYETTVGQRGEATDIWVMPKGLPPLDYTPGDPLGGLVADLRVCAPEESTYYLNPLPYSPLQ